MELLVLTRVYPPYGFGGLALHLNYLYEEIVSRGHEVTILSGKCEGYGEVTIPDRSESENINAHYIEFGYRYGSYILYPLALRRFLNEFDTSGYDAVLTHSQIPYQFEQPVIAKHHDCVRQTRSFVRKGMSPWMKLGESALNLTRPLVDRFAIRAADHLIFVSNFLKESWDELYDISMSTTVIHNGVDLSTFYPRQTARNGGYALFVTGSGDGQKEKLESSGVLEFARKSQYDVIVAGRSDVDDSNVTALGRLNHEELAKVYSAAGVTIHPSQFEPFGNIILESLACGTPVVTTKEVGAREILDPTCGVVTDDLQHGVKTAMGLDSRDCVETARKHTWTRVADETLAIVESLVDT